MENKLNKGDYFFSLMALADLDIEVNDKNVSTL